MRKIPRNCPKDDLCENCCFYLVLAQLQKFQLMLKECLLLLSNLKVLNSVYNLIRDLKVLHGVYNQIANVCHPRLGNIHMLLFKMIVLMYKEAPDKIQNKYVVISFIMLLMLGYQTVPRDQ